MSKLAELWSRKICCTLPLVQRAGWPLTWKTWKSRGIWEWSGKIGKVRENVFLHVVYYREYCSGCKILFLWCNQVGIVNYLIGSTLYWRTVVIVVYISIAVRNNMHFVSYRYCCEGRYSVSIDNDWRVAILGRENAACLLTDSCSFALFIVILPKYCLLAA